MEDSEKVVLNLESGLDKNERAIGKIEKEILEKEEGFEEKNEAWKSGFEVKI